MGKLSCYCINSALAINDGVGYYSIPTHMGMTVKGWDKMPSQTFEKLRMHIQYAFDDRFDVGNNLDSVIYFMENLYPGHSFVLNTLKKLQKAEFEGYSVSTVSNNLLIWLFSVEHRIKFQTICLFSTRHGMKKFRKFKKAFDSWIDEEQQYEDFMRTQVLPGYNKIGGNYDE